MKKSASGAVDRARAESSRRGHSISIELLDEQGKEDGRGSGKEICGNLVPRKRAWEFDEVPTQGESFKKAAEEVANRGINKMITIIVRNRGINKTITVDPRGKKGVEVRVEVQPHERWIGNATVLMRAFQNLISLKIPWLMLVARSC